MSRARQYTERQGSLLDDPDPVVCPLRAKPAIAGDGGIVSSFTNASIMNASRRSSRFSTPLRPSGPGKMMKATSSNGIHRDTALDWLELGNSPVPPRLDGSKAPHRRYPDRRSRTVRGHGLPTRRSPPAGTTSKRGTGGDCTGNGVACGYGGLELFEFDDRATYEAFKGAAAAVGLGDLVERIEAGYLEETPGGGRPLVLRLRRDPGIQQAGGAAIPGRAAQAKDADRDEGSGRLRDRRPELREGPSDRRSLPALAGPG